MATTGERLLTEPLDVGLHYLTVLGGTGFPVTVGQRLGLRAVGDWIYLMPPSLEGEHVHAFPRSQLTGIDVSGPGTVTSGGGFIGGGFGVGGALEGMAIAGALNAITTKKKVLTFLRLDVEHGELFLHCETLDPYSLRIYLSPLFVDVRNRRAASL